MSVCIEKMQVDAIVNAANERLQRGGGVCGAIFGAVERVGGESELVAACRAIGGCPTGDAAVTPSFGLPAPWIIHAVGPVWSDEPHVVPPALNDRTRRELELLGDAYAAIVARCRENGFRSVAVPAISTGIFGLPKELGAIIAHDVMGRLGDGLDIRLVAFDQASLGFLNAEPLSAHLALLDGIIGR